MRIVDAQVHICSSGKPTNPNHRQIERFSKDDLLKEMDEAGIDAALIHPPGVVGSRLQRAGRRGRAPAPEPAGDPRHFPLDRPESRGLIDGWKRGGLPARNSLR
jgi:hypothetical protein